MAITLKSTGGNVVGVGNEAASALHATSKPIPASVGHFRVARRFVPIASATANANFIAMRNASANLVMPTHIRLRILQTGVPTAAIEHRVGIFVARGYSAADGTGIGATLTLSGNNAKKRTSMSTTGVVITETSAAGGLTGGTKTLDVDPMGLATLWVLAAVSTTAPNESIYEWEASMGDGAHPLTLAQNEGICFQLLGALGAASGVVYMYEIAWAESSTF